MQPTANKRGLLIAAAASGNGKTTITLGLLRALAHAGHDVAAAKSGPDYIDPGFHQSACGHASVNLDAWAMRPDRLRQLATRQPGELLLIEGAMGLFDGAIDGPGSAADVAAALGVPVILVLDVRRQGQTAAVLAQGLACHRPGVRVAGVILNHVGSPRHEHLLRKAFADLAIDVFGCIPSRSEFGVPSRHLGLVQAGELVELEALIDKLAGHVIQHIDLEAVAAAAETIALGSVGRPPAPPPGRKIAVAMDSAFAFAYPHMLEDWRLSGALIEGFSPLADQGPTEGCDAIFLPGGYPELFAERLACAHDFRQGMRAAAMKGVPIYGECGGFMVLGDALVDAEGATHEMLGLLPLTTSFQERRRQLGYRHLHRHDDTYWRGHEFHMPPFYNKGRASHCFVRGQVASKMLAQVACGGAMSAAVSCT